MKTDKEIAQLILQALAGGWSWSTIETNILMLYSNKSAFALTLQQFGWQYVDDVVVICRKVVAMKD